MPQFDADEQRDGAPQEWSAPPKPASRHRRPFRLVTALLVLVGLYGLGAAFGPLPSFQRDRADAEASAVGNSLNSGVSIFPVAKRVRAPALRGATVAGPDLDPAALRDKVVVVNVWGSWCAPCRAEAPDLARVSNENKSKGVIFVGIDVRDDRGSAQAFTRRYKIPYGSLFDPGGKQLVKFASIIPISAVPSTVVIDRSGRVAARMIGRTTYKILNGFVQDVLTEPSTGGTS